MAFDAKDLGKDLAKNAASITVGAVLSGGVDPTKVVEAALGVGALLWKAGAYLNHRSTVQTSLAACLKEYCDSGFLKEIKLTNDAKPCYQTTDKFSEARPILRTYPDIDQYIKDEAITDQELKNLGIDSTVTIHIENTVVKGLGHIKQRLSVASKNSGIRDLTKSDAEKRLSYVSDMQMGAIALQNAFTAEGQRRQRGEPPMMVPVLGRILGLAALCGITDIALGDITTILGRGPVFETTVRSRIAKLRDGHASQVFNTVLFMGNTQSTARGFGQQASSWAGERIMVGRVRAPRKSEFVDEFAIHCNQLSGPPNKKHEVGKPIYMLEGWANLLKQRECFEREHGTWKQMVHIHAPTSEKDIHGNSYMSAGNLGKVVFKVKEMPDGTLMAKPRKFDQFDYLAKADYDKGRGRSKATGEEKLFGGIVGPVICKCKGIPDDKKGGLTKSWKLGPDLKIYSRDHVANSIAHTQQLSTKHVSVLWRPGDWLVGAFLMSVLPQSSYMQGKAECLHCAIETAALTGCAEVIACGGGRVSREALERPATISPVVHPTMSVKAEATNELKTPDRESLKDTATALYDYEPRAEHDLDFKKGDVIEIIIRGKEENEWWIGKFNGKQGAFPAKYVRLDSAQPASALPPKVVMTSAPVQKPVASTATLPFTPPASPGPSSPPPAYDMLSPSAPPASTQMEYFAVGDYATEIGVPKMPVIRRKPVAVSPTTTRSQFSSELLDTKVLPRGLGVYGAGTRESEELYLV